VDAPAAGTAGASAAELDAYREQAELFLQELNREQYLHYAGLKERLELDPIYERHAELTELERVRTIARGVDGGRRVRELWRFACEGHLGALTREHTERIARLETELQATVDGTNVGFRMLAPTIANEPDRGRRERLERAQRELTEEHLNPVYVEAAELTRETVPAFGLPTYLDLYRRFGFDLDELADECRDVLDSTERLWEESADRLFRARVGLGLDEAERWDVPRVFRAPEWDSAFPKEGMLRALEGTLAELGVALRAQENIKLDVEARPLKTPRAFCVPIEIPARIMLVIQPIGGPDDWHALFHEAGHAEHFAHASATLAFEEKRLGDNAVTEAWAMLIEHLVDEPAWLTRRLDVPRPTDFAREGATLLLYFVRRYAAKLLYEVELHGGGELGAMRGRYVELLAEALKIEPSDANFLADVDPGFYASAYLRAWAAEAQLRTFLREEFGNAWFTRREAGSLLRELWSEGQRMTADELLRELTGADLALEAVAERIRETLAR
jgi:hypothetical protein